jgi:hypothetical protein
MNELAALYAHFRSNTHVAGGYSAMFHWSESAGISEPLKKCPIR